MANSKIEWTEKTWNPVTGCTKISPGCQNCYAERMSKRLAGRCGYPKRNPFEVTYHHARLSEPYGWRKPARVFVCSMGDLFHEDVTDKFIIDVLSIMAEASQHTFLVLTKRPERMKEIMTHDTVANDVWLQTSRGCNDEPSPWPLSNVWLGVTAENQEQADKRIPILLQIPAAVRFVSVEPMLRPVDLNKWIMPRTPFTPENAPKSWDEFAWPDWVPGKVREQIESFWGQFGRGPKDWAENAISNDSPPFGMQMGYQEDGRTVYGRWIFAWNNIGRLVDDKGNVYYPSIPRAHLLDTTRYYWHDLHWVICGGESGPGARPMHPDWVRSLRDQCAAAGVPFFFKQWGEWEAFYDRDIDDPDWRDIPEYGPGITRLNLAGGTGFHGERVVYFRKVGKKAAGRLLDGRIWDEAPGGDSPAS